MDKGIDLFRVAANALVIRKPKKILLIKSTLPERGWELPGGHIEYGENLKSGLIREVFEESGIHIIIDCLTAIHLDITNPGYIFCFNCNFLEGVPTPSIESLEVKWVEIQEALDLVTEPSMRERLLDCLNYNGSIMFRSYTTIPFNLMEFFNL